MSYQLKFDVGFATGNQRICFREKDKIGPQILKLLVVDFGEGGQIILSPDYGLY